MPSVATVKIIGGPKGTLIVNESDLPKWRELGYRLEGEKVEKPAKAEKAEKIEKPAKE